MNEIFSSRFSSEFVFRAHSAIPWGSFCGLLTVTVLIFFFVVFINYCLGIHFFFVYIVLLYVVVAGLRSYLLFILI